MEEADSMEFYADSAITKLFIAAGILKDYNTEMSPRLIRIIGIMILDALEILMAYRKGKKPEWIKDTYDDMLRRFEVINYAHGRLHNKLCELPYHEG